MFTGIIEEKGTISKIMKNASQAVLTIKAQKIMEDIHKGDSIAVNGICLTVTAFSPTGQELTSLFLKLFPMVLLLIFLISFVGAILCSRIMVKPVLEISRISKRMSNLDMTWEGTIYFDTIYEHGRRRRRKFQNNGIFSFFQL